MFNEKIAQVIVELAKRLWVIHWVDFMDVLSSMLTANVQFPFFLLTFFLVNRPHQLEQAEVSLATLRTLAEEVFEKREDFTLERLHDFMTHYVRPLFDLFFLCFLCLFGLTFGLLF